MLHIRNALFGFAALAVTACGPMDAVTRGAPFETTMPTVIEAAPAELSEINDVVTRANPDLTSPDLAPLAVAPSFNVVDVRVEVPRSLRVSEANLLYPIADIVWREDPLGDRHAQVAQILTDAVREGTQGFNGAQDVVVFLEVSRFHSLSQRARYSVGGDHSIKFDLSLLDPTTGAVLVGPQYVDASFDALGGQTAIEAEANGLTQKVRINSHVSAMIAQELNALQSPATLQVAAAQ